jgi:hypothetical protein
MASIEEVTTNGVAQHTTNSIEKSDTNKPLIHLWQGRCVDQIIFGAFIHFPSFMYVWVGDSHANLNTLTIALQTSLDITDDHAVSTSCTHLLGLSDMNESLARRLSVLFKEKYIVSVSVEINGLDDANGQLLRIWIEKRIIQELKSMNLC